MKRQICFYFSSMILMLLFACAPVTINQFLSDGQKPLTQRQLQVLISNQSIHLEAIDFDAQVHYLPNGHLTATNRQGVKDSGKWNISSESRLCMKFSQWYYGDLKCYQVFNDKDSYVFFTTNGARYYTATMPGGNGYDAANHSRNEISNHEAQSRDAPAVLSESNSTRTTVFLSEAEKRRALFNLARNCPDCNFAGVDLRGAELIAANMAGANLAGADLREANLRRANLSGANLSGANLAGSNLAGADLSNCDLSDADLTGSNLIRATVTGAKLDGSVLDGAHLESIQGLKD